MGKFGKSKNFSGGIFVKHFAWAISAFNIMLIGLGVALFLGTGKDWKSNRYLVMQYTVNLFGAILFFFFGLDDLLLGIDKLPSIKNFQMVIDKSEIILLGILGMYFLGYGFVLCWLKENWKREVEKEKLLNFWEFMKNNKLFFLNFYTVVGVILLLICYYLVNNA